MLMLIKTQQYLQLNNVCVFLQYVQKPKMQTNNGAPYFWQKYEASEATLTMKTMEKSQKANALGLHIQF